MHVSTEILAILDRATCEGNALSLAALGRLSPKVYAATNKVLEAAGGKWNRKAGAHLFDGDAAEAIEPIILTGEIVSRKVEFQQFDTPPELAARVIALARIKPEMFVLEPSAGRGGLALPLTEAGFHVHCIELDERRAAQLALDGAGSLDVRRADFLACAPGAVHDRVIMNPPFAGQADIRHVMHAARFLKPGGRLVAIMSAGIRLRRNRLADEFRAFLDDHGAVIEDLPHGAFKASGTNVAACLVSFDLGGAP